MQRPLRIGFLGGVPAALGGGGLELQRERTQAALERRGHAVVRLECAPRGEGIDLVHAFGSEPGTWHTLQNWRLARRPLVVTSVIVVSPGRVERVMRLSLRVPRAFNTAERMRLEVVRAADAVIAGNSYERGLLTGPFRCDGASVHTIGNGYDPVTNGAASPPVDLPAGFALLVGTITARKRQTEVLTGLAHDLPVVVAGPFQGSAAERAAWDAAVRSSGAVWLGETSREQVRELQRRAGALVHLSTAEVESLAVIETLGEQTPVVLSDIPSHRELRSRYPDWVRVVARVDEVSTGLGELLAIRDRRAPAVPTWDDIAASVERVYFAALDG